MISSRAAGRVSGFAHCPPPRRSWHFVDNGRRPRGERDTCIPTFCACITTPQMGLFTLLRGAKPTGALKILQHSALCTQRDAGVRTDVLRRTNEG